MKSTKIIALLLVVVMCFGMLVSCFGNNECTGHVDADDNGKCDKCGADFEDGDEGAIKEGDFTYNSYASALGTNWNPHTWENSSDSSVLGFIESPFATIVPLDTKEGVYQWTYEMATSITDVTASNQDKLAKYGVEVPEGGVTEGYVFEIKLNPNAKWQNGDVINADDYIYSMQQLLNPKMKNYRANLYISGEAALAGAFNYYYSLDEGYYYSFVTKYGSLADAVAAETVYIDAWNFWGAKGYTDAEGNQCPQWLPVDDQTVYGEAQGDAFTAALLYQYYYNYLNVGGGYESCAGIYVANENYGATWDGVGLYKSDDYTIYYVCQTAIDFNYFLTSCTSTWLVYEELYESLKKEEGGLIITTYGTSKETTMSYGPYMIETYEDNKQMVYVQNPNWYGYEKTESGYLYSMTSYDVDGEPRQQYQTTKVVIDVMTQEVAFQKFFKGEVMEYAPTAEELKDYTLSDRLYREDETYTMSFFFNTDIEKLQALDADGGTNTNSIVLSNENFRKAFSLAFNRADFVTVTEGYTPAYSLMNKLYYYDIYNDPASSYRNSEPAMQAICNLYGVKYGDGEIYKTLEEAYNSITGYNLTEAQALMKTACEELVAAGLYTAGEDIHITIGWKAGAMEDPDQKQVDKVAEYLNAAVKGSGFGKVTIQGVGNISNRYADTANGIYAIGYGAWGGAWMYPFRNFQVYCDPTQYSIHEAGCWDPTSETLTLIVGGEEVTLTWQQWSNSMIGEGQFANVSNDVKLEITAQMEEEFLKKYYRIPLCGTTICSLLSYKADYYTQNYNVMYGFGGFNLMTYNYTDAEWEVYVAEQGGNLNYQ